MTDRLEDLLRACTVRVTGGPMPGAGFFVAPGKVLTCVHVIGDGPALTVTWEPDNQSPLVVPVSSPVAVLPGKGRPIPALDRDYPDIAVLQIGGFGDHPCVRIDLDWPSAEDIFQVFGYPQEGGAIRLTPARLTYRGTHGAQPTAYLDLASDTIKPGMSGAAVLNLHTGGVCGVVVASKHPSRPDGALAIPWSSIAEDLGDVLAANRAFHHRDLRWAAAASRDTIIQKKPSPAAHRPPRLLPRGNPDFVNRISELKKVEGWAYSAAQAPIIVFTGSAGVGKTALALNFCHTHADSHPDGALFTDLGGFGGRARRTSDVLAEFLLALSVPVPEIPLSLEDRQNLYRTITAGLHMVVLIDNAAQEAQVRDLLPAGPSVLVVVTSRRRLGGLTEARILELNVLNSEAATGLLRLITREETADLSERSLSQIAKQCGNLPLALMISGARLNALENSDKGRMITMLGDEKHRLRLLSVGDLEVRTSFFSSYAYLSTEEQRAFRMLSRMDGGFFGNWHLAALLDTHADKADDILARLRDLHLIEVAPAKDGCDHTLYRFHDLIRDFSNELFSAAGEDSGEPDSRLIRAYWEILSTMGQELSPIEHSGFVGDTVELTGIGLLRIDDHAAWCNAEYSNTFMIAKRAYNVHRWSDTITLSGALLPFFQSRSLWGTAEEFYALAMDAAEKLGDVSAKAKLLLSIAAVRRSQARWAESVSALQECLALYEKGLATKEQAYALASIGISFRNEGAWDAAWLCFIESRDILLNLGEPWGVAFATRGLGIVCQSQGRWNEALAYFSETVDLFHEVGDTGREAMAWVRIGAVLRVKRRAGPALRIYERVLPIFTEQGNRTWIGITAVHQAAALSDSSDHDAAVNRLDLAQSIFVKADDKRWEAITLLHRGIVHRRIGRTKSAHSYLGAAYVKFIDIGDRPGIAKAMLELGILFRDIGDEPQMRASLMAAHAAFNELGSPEAARIAAMLDKDQRPLSLV